MQASNSPDLRKTLLDLAESDFPYVRREAAHRLGQLLASSDEIVSALMTAETLDRDPGVRSAASLALQSPIHQAFIRAHADFVRTTADSTARARAEEEHRRQEEIIEEFMRRRDRERVKALIFLGSFTLAWCSVFLLSYEWVLGVLRLLPVAVMLAAVLMLWLSWKNWRCPSCDGWLGSWKAQINPFFSSAPLRCPHCGIRLL